MKVMLITTKMNVTYLANAEVFADKVKMKEPVQVIIQATKEGPMMAFLPYLEYCEQFKIGIEIPYESILTINTPVKELENQYNQMFGSGIQIASVLPSKL